MMHGYHPTEDSEEDENTYGDESSSPLRSRKSDKAPAAEEPVCVPELRVIARVRPTLRDNVTSIAQTPDGAGIQVTAIEKQKLKRGLKKGDPPISTTYQSTQVFNFNKVFWLNKTTRDIYVNEVASLVDAVMAGTTGCIFAYGQTGSGKTFSLTGCPRMREKGEIGEGGDAALGAGGGGGGKKMPSHSSLEAAANAAADAAGSHAGLMQMSATQLMTAVEQHNLKSAALEKKVGPRSPAVSYLRVYVAAGEIYQEKLLDLGYPPGGEKIRKLTATTLRRIPIASNSAEELIDTVEALIDRRAAGATNKNEHSSRSHAVYTINLQRITRATAAEAIKAREEEGSGVSFQPDETGGIGSRSGPAVEGWLTRPAGCLGLVDLAGAEYAAATEGCDDKRRLEGGANNLGLMSLKAAFRYLGEAQTAIAAAGAGNPKLLPFSWSRSSLTRILRPFFTTPGARLLMLVTASPEAQDTSQTQQALTEGVIISGRALGEKTVVDLGPDFRPPPTALYGNDSAGNAARAVAIAAEAQAQAAAAAAAARKAKILKAGSGSAGGRKGAAAAPAAGPPPPSGPLRPVSAGSPLSSRKSFNNAAPSGASLPSSSSFSTGASPSAGDGYSFEQPAPLMRKVVVSGSASSSSASLGARNSYDGSGSGSGSRPSSGSGRASVGGSGSASVGSAGFIRKVSVGGGSSTSTSSNSARDSGRGSWLVEEAEKQLNRGSGGGAGGSYASSRGGYDRPPAIPKAPSGPRPPFQYSVEDAAAAAGGGGGGGRW